MSIEVSVRATKLAARSNGIHRSRTIVSCGNYAHHAMQSRGSWGVD